MGSQSEERGTGISLFVRLRHFAQPNLVCQAFLFLLSFNRF
jgi:hypothetical protein